MTKEEKAERDVEANVAQEERAFDLQRDPGWVAQNAPSG
jgi:hypothetical protein